MPPARSPAAARSAARRADPQPRRPTPKRVVLPGSMLRLRWERLGRVALLVVLAAVIGLYAEHTISYLSTHSQAAAAKAQLDTLAAQHHALLARRNALHNPMTITRDARGLGMVRPGEQPYTIIGHSGH
jgi:cell division protein FtsB